MKTKTHLFRPHGFRCLVAATALFAVGAFAETPEPVVPAEVRAAAVATDPLAAIHGLIARVLPAAEAERFDCEVLPEAGGYDQCEYGPAPKNRIVLRGNSGVSLAVAFNQYLRTEARLDFDWLADSPLQLRTPLPVPSRAVRLTCAAPQRFFLNYCTYGYTFPWWDWARWERFIDWMAMNGVNRPLLQSGQEAVWLRVWQSYGLSADEVRTYFSAPAHLPWHRMGNLDRWGGPLPQSYIDAQEKLQKRIVARVRDFGMSSILPAFSGHVPPELSRVRPAAKIVRIKPGWSGMAPEYATSFLDPTDPLFAEIQRKFVAEQTRLYGTDHLYATDPFNEMTPPNWEPSYLASVARGIFSGLSEADPEAQWYEMTWTFTYQKREWTPDRLRAMLHAVPRGRLVLLDYAGEETGFYDTHDGAYGLPFVWNYLGNFGGNTHLQAPLAQISRLESNALSAKNCVGVGSTLEALGVNPVAYELVFDRPWQGPDFDPARWVESYAERRAGGRDPAVADAWAQLFRRVFIDHSPRTGTYGSIFQAMPEMPEWHGRKLKTGVDYRTQDLMQAVERLLQASAESRASDSYRYDVVNLTREVLCDLGLEAHGRMLAALRAEDLTRFRRESADFLALGRDLDDLLGTRREFLLGVWLAEARNCGAAPEERDYFEANAREILTAWHRPGGELTDYASRQWNGLIRDYYLPRWEKWIQLQDEALERGTPFRPDDYLRWVNDACRQWIGARDAARYAAHPVGDPVATAERLLEKYREKSAATSR